MRSDEAGDVSRRGIFKYLNLLECIRSHPIKYPPAKAAQSLDQRTTLQAVYEPGRSHENELDVISC